MDKLTELIDKLICLRGEEALRGRSDAIDLGIVKVKEQLSKAIEEKIREVVNGQ